MRPGCLTFLLVVSIAAPAVAWDEADDAAMDDLGMVTALAASCGGAGPSGAAMESEVGKYVAIHAKTPAERARADSRKKAAIGDATQQLKTAADPRTLCKLKDAAIADFIGRVKKANSTRASYQPP